MLVSCVPMREQIKTMRKGTLFQAGQFAALSSFRVGKFCFCGKSGMSFTSLRKYCEYGAEIKPRPGRK